MTKKDLYQNLNNKNYSLVINDLLKYLNLFIKAFNRYSYIHKNLNSLNKSFNSNYENLKSIQENQLIYDLINIIEELPEKYYDLRQKYQKNEDWIKIQDTVNMDDIYNFLAKYPDSEYIPIIEQDLNLTPETVTEINYWNNCLKKNSISTYYEYKKKYPKGLFFRQSKEKIDNLKFGIKKKSNNYTALHEKYWLNVKKENSEQAYSNYLKNFPSGIYRYNAKSKIKHYSNAKETVTFNRKRNIILFNKSLKISAFSIISVLLIYATSILFLYFKAENYQTKNNSLKAIEYYRIASKITFGLVLTETYNSTYETFLAKWWNSLDNELKHALFSDKFTLVYNVSDIKNLINLDTANLSQMKISDLNFLQPLTNLRILNLSETQISDLNPLSQMKNLEILDISKTNVKDLGPLKHNKNLLSLNCNYLSEIDDLSPLFKLKKLQKLFVHNAELKDVSDISKIESLTDLNIASNNISDISQLENLQNLKYLCCEENPINSLDVINNLPNLNQIYICNILVSEFEIYRIIVKYNSIYNTNLNYINCNCLVDTE